LDPSPRRAPPCDAASFRQLRLGALGKWMAVDLQEHRHRLIPAHDADEIDDSSLWSVRETIISVVGLAAVLALRAFV
jgi:hypothetical protein